MLSNALTAPGAVSNNSNPQDSKTPGAATQEKSQNLQTAPGSEKNTDVQLAIVVENEAKFTATDVTVQEKRLWQEPSSETRVSDAPFFKVVFDDVLLTPQVLNYNYSGGGTESNPYICEFLPGDPRNPQAWSSFGKWMVSTCAASVTFGTTFCSSTYTGATSGLVAEFNSTTTDVTLGLSLFVLGYVIGPLLWGPLSELYGRRYIMIATFAALTAFNAGVTGANNLPTILALRTLGGIFGSSPLSNAGGIIADVFAAEQRGVAMAIFAATPFMGPCVGPIVGGFTGQYAGWRWVMGVMTIVAGVLWILAIVAVPETYAPVILERRAKALQQKTGNVFRTRLQIGGHRPTPAQAFGTAISRPWILLFMAPIVLIISTYMAIVYGTLYLMFGAFPIVYQVNRGWSGSISGLAFLGILVGCLAALAYTIYDNRGRYLKLSKAAQVEGQLAARPEARLPPAMIGSIALPIGLFSFAWTNGPEIHWIVSIIATVPFGFGMIMVFLPLANYMIDSYTIYTASIFAGSGILRSLFGFAFPLFTTHMYDLLGIHWASSVPAFLALACVPFPFVFYKYGERIRVRCKYSREATETMAKLMRQAK